MLYVAVYMSNGMVLENQGTQTTLGCMMAIWKSKIYLVTPNEVEETITIMSFYYSCIHEQWYGVRSE